MRYLVDNLSIRLNNVQSTYIAGMIEKLVIDGLVPPKAVCVTILNHDTLNPDRPIFWNTSFRLITNVIKFVDYKGVREIMKAAVDRCRLLPVDLEHLIKSCAKAVYELLELICDPEATLLPGYFIVNELLKLSPDYQNWPHWILSELLTNFVEKFKICAQILTVINRPYILPIVDNSSHNGLSIKSYKLDCNTLKFVLKGTLPYPSEVMNPQPELLAHVMRQLYSKDMVLNMLDIKKQRCPALEEQFVTILVSSLKFCHESTENNGDVSKSNIGVPDHVPCPCSHMINLFVNYMYCQIISFPSVIETVHKLLAKVNDRRGRDHLMWIILQCVSMTLQKTPFTDYLPVLRLIEFLYPENVLLPAPDVSDRRCVKKCSAMSILIHILKRAQQADGVKTPRSLPPAFTNQNELVQSLVQNIQLSPHLAFNPAAPDFRIALLMNAFSTNGEIFHRPLHTLAESIQSSQKTTVPMPGVNCVAHGATVPLPMELIDTLSMHVKLNLIQNIFVYITKQAHNKSTIALAPALVETYGRLLVYMDSETHGIKHFINNMLPMVFKSSIWGILHGLLELFSYRIHHSPSHCRVQLLSTIHHMSGPLNSLHHITQLHLCLESVALRLISGLGNSEVMSNFTRVHLEHKSIISGESEELNKVGSCVKLFIYGACDFAEL